MRRSACCGGARAFMLEAARQSHEALGMHAAHHREHLACAVRHQVSGIVGCACKLLAAGREWAALCQTASAARHEQPAPRARVLQITELVRECLQQRDANCSITPAPPESCADDSAAALLQARPLRRAGRSSV